MGRKIFFTATILCLSWIIHARDFWMQPKRFRIKTGEMLSVGFKVGENFAGERWEFIKDRIQRMEWHQAKTIQDIKKLVTDGEKENLNLALSKEGTHLFVFESAEELIRMDGEKFNEYLREKGLDEALQQRTKQNMLTDSASEFCSRHSKLLVQAGYNTDGTYHKEVGLPIEIIPLQNPYSRKIGDRIAFRILYLGRPVFGARVKIFNLHNNRTTIQNIYTQQDGTVETTVSNPGSWLVSVVKMIPSQDPGADWRSYWGTLAFGI